MELRTMYLDQLHEATVSIPHFTQVSGKMLLLLTITLLISLIHASPLDTLAHSTSSLESLRNIKNIQKQISHLAQLGEWRTISHLFTPNSTFTWANTTLHGPPAIETWLHTDSQGMDGIQPGSLNTLIAETPVISLSADGQRAKGRWNGLWFQGDGQGGTRIRGGVYENEYLLTPLGWRISLLRYHDMYDGTYADGWKNVGSRGIGYVPFHFTPESAGVPMAVPHGDVEVYEGTIGELESRIQRLNDEDEVRNLVHARGFYVDRRMWGDVVDLHTENTTVRFGNGSVYMGKEGVMRVLEAMGPEGLTRGINNDHPIFDMIVQADGDEAIARGIEIEMLGAAKTHAASWEFNVFRHRCVKENGVWKVQDVEITPLIVADYYEGWGRGGLRVPNTYLPPFLNVTGKLDMPSPSPQHSSNATVEDLTRHLLRSAAFDGSENLSHAYGYYADDILGPELGGLFAKQGHKLSPFAGFFHTPARITGAMTASYGTNRSTLRASVSYHWRPQPVILVSQDGRSATMRARLLQPSTSITKAGSFNSAIYHDQVVLEEGKWRLWSVTIDEFYWQSTSWKEGWVNPKPRNSSAPNPEPAGWTKKYPPDATLAEVGERESTFRGGGGTFIEWPDIQRMWFQYRNPVSGREPEWYWPGCVPCQVRREWSLEANGYQEPSTGP
ncbi:hypothetical protein HBH50_234210 [Parastagonospora nodorum]|nr:hypothetical protein HBH50_234210 [Parastagonospora nodorum]KAH4078488.1 hypothetical protein HBH48_231200 [Parastagonospora nodorum]